MPAARAAGAVVADGENQEQARAAGVWAAVVAAEWLVAEWAVAAGAAEARGKATWDPQWEQCRCSKRRCNG